jgi:hypothetical protein
VLFDMPANTDEVELFDFNTRASRLD